MKKRRINKGQPLNELVKGSLNYTMERLRTAFRAQFRSEDAYWNWYIVEVFADHVIVMDDQLPPDEFYRVSYTAQGASYAFAARDAWEIVELAYQSRSVQERRSELAGRGGRITLIESHIAGARIELLEAEAGKPRRIKVRGMTANIINNNNRRYRSTILEAAVREAQTLISERRLLAESGHPSDKPSGQPDILESLVRWDSITFEGDEVLLEGEIIPTKGKGENLIILMEHGVYPRVSQRANGKAQMVEESGRRFVDITELHITGYDLVMDPGDPTADTLVFENRQPHHHIEEDPMTMDLEQFRKQYPELVGQIEREHDELRRLQLEQALQERQRTDAERQRAINEHNAALRTQLGLNETDNLEEAVARQAAELVRLQEAEQARAVVAYIEQEISGIKYADVIKTQFIERVKKAGAKTVEAAKVAIVEARKEYDAIQSSLELAARGRGGVDILGPVLERDRGVPEFARASFALTESLIRSGNVEPRDLRQPKTINERFAQQYLERFDRAYRHHLLAEARTFEEAEQASDLNLPYTVARTVMAEALPMLVALSIFDVQLVEPAPTTNIFFEVYSAEFRRGEHRDRRGNRRRPGRLGEHGLQAHPARHRGADQLGRERDLHRGHRLRDRLRQRPHDGPGDDHRRAVAQDRLHLRCDPQGRTVPDRARQEHPDLDAAGDRRRQVGDGDHQRGDRVLARGPGLRRGQPHADPPDSADRAQDRQRPLLSGAGFRATGRQQ